jgi:hypothetical protein
MASGSAHHDLLGGALHSAFSGLWDVDADRPFSGIAFNKMRSASAKPAARQAPPGAEARTDGWGGKGFYLIPRTQGAAAINAFGSTSPNAFGSTSP